MKPLPPPPPKPTYFIGARQMTLGERAEEKAEEKAKDFSDNPKHQTAYECGFLDGFYFYKELENDCLRCGKNYGA